MLLGAVAVIRAEISLPHELEGLAGLCLRQAGLHLTAGEHFQGIRVEDFQEIVRIRIRYGEQIAVETDFRIDSGLNVRPVNGTLDLPAIRRIAAAGLRVVFRIDLDYIAVRILFAAGAAHDVGGL